MGSQRCTLSAAPLFNGPSE
ncbi:putative 3-ketoacyl-coa thiolase-like protein [Leishmania donovani]|uniref:Putative 3-ketoacyl-coa thiolase-like protein n=1 Tax=Leishmania donovani TaxID=5661 RepID=E9BMU0_LEIDO|nr:putative 3-ketoacyl-coa thiolase-like protein [Leishmania donovani]CBZ36568.1 putative 3-ketoacyl-coa thiolase-like protein [Leishmania donovani]